MEDAQLKPLRKSIDKRLGDQWGGQLDYLVGIYKFYLIKVIDNKDSFYCKHSKSYLRNRVPEVLSEILNLDKGLINDIIIYLHAREYNTKGYTKLSLWNIRKTLEAYQNNRIDRNLNFLPN